MTSCGNKSKENTGLKNENPSKINQEFSIDKFSDYPPKIDGCSCFFSNDSVEFNNKEFIYMNDFASISFLKINGEIIKFTQTDFREVDNTKIISKAKSAIYEIIIEVNDGKRNGDESMLKTGKIKLTDKNGKTLTKTFYGECGC